MSSQLGLGNCGADGTFGLPRAKLAAVLVLLSLSSDGQRINVTLTTRATTMRTFAGETALPGGRMEAGDTDVWETALREANEEIELPLDIPLVRLCAMPTFVSATLLFVVPVVAFLAVPTASAILDALVPSPAECSAVWSVPLLSVLDPATATMRYKFDDVPWVGGRPFRLHSFDRADLPSPITGLTADILIDTAELASGGSVALPFARRARDQMAWTELVDAVLEGRAGDAADRRTKTRARSGDDVAAAA